VVEVAGAEAEADARAVAKSVAESPLVKAAAFG
jgi:N-acetylglutamate synthase/N-acetylornithine aminotransferase